MSKIRKIKIIDNIKDQISGAIEVEISFVDQESRWCFFINSSSMASFGDSIINTNIKHHYGSTHMIVIAGEITEKIIHDILYDFDQREIINQCTVPISIK